MPCFSSKAGIPLTLSDGNLMLGLGEKITTTYDGDGTTVNVQSGWGKKA